jgi:GTP-binding protein HflX
MPRASIPTVGPRERALLVGVEFSSDAGLLTLDESLEELSLLAETAGLEVSGRATQRLGHPDPRTYIGSGKVTEIRALAASLDADLILFDGELSPRHQRELEKAFGENVRAIDRTALILDVFAQHAQTREGALQVELAQYEYRLPRLTRAWTHLARQAGGGAGRSGNGGVGLRGPGETQLEVDRRDISRRISHIKKELERVRAHRKRHRTRRRESKVPTVALVGYTNAGKSTLLNRLTGAGVLEADRLFATLDPTTRKVMLPGGTEILLTDTVGFIQKLPTTLVAAFRATLEEISEADLLLHVVDVTHSEALAQARSVRSTLEEIGAAEIPIVTALNKVDRLAEMEDPVWSGIDDGESGVPVSARTGEGIDRLTGAVEEAIVQTRQRIEVFIPYNDTHLISRFHEICTVEETEHRPTDVRLVGHGPGALLGEFDRYVSSGAERR